MESNQSPKLVKYCHCGSLIKSRTSWIDLNPGRCFGACDNNQNLIIMKQKNRVGEHYFRWLDKETYTRGKDVVPGLET
ncbi:hypothetical protein ACE6H2_020938 [Prunus campanulata]